MSTAEEIKQIVAEYSPEAKCQDSLKGGLEGVLVCITNEDRSRENAEWFPLTDDRDTVIKKAKAFTVWWAEGDQPS